MKINRNILLLFLTIFIFRISLDFSYIYFVSKYFDYMGFTLVEISVSSILISYLSLFFVSSFAPSLCTRPSQFFGGVFFLFSYLPLSSFVTFARCDILPTFIISLVYIMLFVSLNINFGVKISLGFNLKFPFHINPSFLLLFFIFIFGFGGLLLKFGIVIPKSLTGLYVVREQYTGSLIGGWTAYIVSWLGPVVIPSLIVFLVYMKKYFWALLFVLSLFILFGITGNKSYLFSLFLVMITYLGVKSFRERLVQFYCSVLSILVIISMLFDSLSSTLYLSSFVIRRMFFTPALIFHYYWDFFSENNKLFFSNSILRRFLENSYEEPIPEIIGKLYFGVDTSANGGIWADSVANLGLFGPFCILFLLLFILKISDQISDGKDPRIVLSFLSLGIYTMCNSAFFTTLLTHGFLLSLLIIALIPKNKNYLHRSLRAK